MVAHNPLGDAEMLTLIRFEARQLRDRLPVGYDMDDLESVGNEAVVEALARADQSDPVRFKATVRQCVRDRMKSFIKSLKTKGRSASRLPVDENGDTMPVQDRKADDPSERAAALERLGTGQLLPSPSEAATRAAALRDAMFESIRVEHVRSMMESIGAKAAKGDLASARFIRDLVQGPATGPVQQTAVVINTADI